VDLSVGFNFPFFQNCPDEVQVFDQICPRVRGKWEPNRKYRKDIKIRTYDHLHYYRALGFLSGNL
jgi:hypothetical protein